MPAFPAVPSPSSLNSDVVLLDQDQTITSVKTHSNGAIVGNIYFMPPPNGSDDIAAFTAAYAALPAAGGKIVMSAGNYKTSATIVHQGDSVALEGAGLSSNAAAFTPSIGTRITALAGFTGTYVLSVAKVNESQPVGYAHIEGFTVDGASVSGVDGIRWSSHSGTADRVRAERCRDGWTFKGATGSPTWNLYDCTMSKLFSFNNSRDGFVMGTNSTDMHFAQCVGGTNGQDGLHVTAGAGTQYVECHWYDSSRYNANLEGGGSYGKWFACRFDNCAQHGVVIDCANANVFMPQFVGCSFARAGNSANNTYDSLFLTRSSGSNTSQRGLVSGCQFWSDATNKPRYFINLSSGAFTKWSFSGIIHDNNQQTSPINDLTSDTEYQFFDANHIFTQRFPSTNGTRIGVATSEKIALHGSTPVIQRAGAAQAAAAATASTQTTPWGYSTQAQADAIVTLVNEIRATLVEKGIMKGSA